MVAATTSPLIERPTCNHHMDVIRSGARPNLPASTRFIYWAAYRPWGRTRADGTVALTVLR